MEDSGKVCQRLTRATKPGFSFACALPDTLIPAPRSFDQTFIQTKPDASRASKSNTSRICEDNVPQRGPTYRVPEYADDLQEDNPDATISTEPAPRASRLIMLSSTRPLVVPCFLPPSALRSRSLSLVCEVTFLLASRRASRVLDKCGLSLPFL